jgi:hypothetical protein
MGDSGGVIYPDLARSEAFLSRIGRTFLPRMRRGGGEKSGARESPLNEMDWEAIAILPSITALCARAKEGAGRGGARPHMQL